jgi:hypothetical protein
VAKPIDEREVVKVVSGRNLRVLDHIRRAKESLSEAEEQGSWGQSKRTECHKYLKDSSPIYV